MRRVSPLTLLISCSVLQVSMETISYECNESEDSKGSLQCIRKIDQCINSESEQIIHVYLHDTCADPSCCTSCNTCCSSCNYSPLPDTAMLPWELTKCSNICVNTDFYNMIAHKTVNFTCPDSQENSAPKCNPTQVTSTGTSITPASDSDTSTIIAVTLTIIILALVAVIVVILLLYWRFRFKVQRERSYNVNSGPADDTTSYPPAVDLDPLYFKIDAKCSNQIPPHLPHGNYQPHLPQSNKRPPLDQPGTSSVQEKYTGLNANGIEPAGDYEQPIHSIKQSVSLDSQSNAKEKDNCLGSKEMGPHYYETGDSTNAYDTVERIDTNAAASNRGKAGDTINYDTVERIDTDMAASNGSKAGGMSQVLAGDTTNTYDRIDANTRRGDTTNTYDRILRVDANARKGDTTNTYDRMERIDKNAASYKQRRASELAGDTTNSYDTVKRTDTNTPTPESATNSLARDAANNATRSNVPAENRSSTPHQSTESDYVKLKTEAVYATLEGEATNNATRSNVPAETGTSTHQSTESEAAYATLEPHTARHGEVTTIENQ